MRLFPKPRADALSESVRGPLSAISFHCWKSRSELHDFTTSERDRALHHYPRLPPSSTLAFTHGLLAAHDSFPYRRASQEVSRSSTSHSAPPAPYQCYEETAETCIGFVTHVFTCPESPPTSTTNSVASSSHLHPAPYKALCAYRFRRPSSSMTTRSLVFRRTGLVRPSPLHLLPPLRLA